MVLIKKKSTSSRSRKNKSSKIQSHKGGSPASEMVMSTLSDKSTTDTYPGCAKMDGNISSLELYKTTGGGKFKKHKSRKSSKSRKHNKKGRNSQKSKRMSKRRNLKGGGSDWMSSQYSLGSYNAPEASVSNFSSSAAASRNDYMNPPNLGSAGSGSPMGSLEGANVRMVGAPVI